MLADKVFGILWCYSYIKRVLGEDLYDGTLLAEAETAGFDDLDLVGYALGLCLVDQRSVDLVGTG